MTPSRPAATGRASILLTAPPHDAVSGIATHVDQLVRSSVGQAFRLETFQAGGRGAGEPALGAGLRRCMTPFRLLSRLLRHPRPILHINTSLNPRAFTRDLVLLLLAHVTHCAVVWQVHGGTSPAGLCGGNRLIRGALKAVLRIPVRIVVITQKDFDSYATVASHEKIVRINNAVDPAEYPVRGCPPARQSSTVEQPLRVMFLARLVPEKGVLDLIEAMRILASHSDARIVLTIAGSGPLKSEIESRVEANQLRDTVRIVGQVSALGRRALFAESDVMALPTYHRERLPYVLLESMAAGVPPITCAIGGIGELVQHGRDGFIVEPHSPKSLADLLASLATERAQLVPISAACRERVALTCGIEMMAAQFCRLYAEIGSGAPVG